MSFANPGAASLDSWDHSANPAAPLAKARKADPIPDDWDNDDNDDEEDPEKVWEAANSKAPMPEVVTSSNTFSTVISPPPAAFQQSLRILKRPSSSQSSSSSLATLPSDLQQKSYAEREARYQAARDRIFARTPESSGHNDANPQGRSPSSIPSPNTVVIVRQPRGPEAQPQDDENPTTPSGSNAKAFGRRRGGKSRDSPTPRTQPSFTG